jgi:hypothetical protein
MANNKGNRLITWRVRQKELVGSKRDDRMLYKERVTEGYK